MRVWLLPALCLAALSPPAAVSEAKATVPSDTTARELRAEKTVADKEPASHTDIHKQPAKVAESLVQHTAVAQKTDQADKASGGNHYDYTGEIRSLQAQINFKRNIIYQEAYRIWNQVKAQMDEKYNPSLLTIARDKQTVLQEKNTVDSTEWQTLTAANNAKNRADLEKWTLLDNAKKSAALVVSTRNFVTTTANMMRQSGSMMLAADMGTFLNSYQQVRGKLDSKLASIQEKLQTSRQRENADHGKTTTALNVFNAKTAEKARAATTAIAASKRTIQHMKKALKGMTKTVDNEIKAARKSIKKIPQGNEVITTKDFDRYVKDNEDQVSDLLEETYEAVKDKFMGVEDVGLKEYKNLENDATKAGSDMNREVNDLIAEDDKAMEEKAVEGKGIGRKTKELQQSGGHAIEQLQEGVEDFAAKVAQGEEGETSELKTLTEEQIASNEGRVEKEKDDIVKMANVMANEVTDEASETSETVTGKVQKLDEQVQKAIMDGAGDEASMMSAITGARNAAKQLAAQSSSVSAALMTETKAAEKTQEAAKEAADQHIFEMQLEKGQLDQNLKLGVQKYKVTSEGDINKLSADVSGYVPWIEGKTWPKLSTALRFIADYLAQEKEVQTEDLAKLQNQLKTVQESLRRYGAEDQVTSVEVPQLIGSAKTDLASMKSWLDSLAKDRSRAKAQVEQSISVMVQDGKNWVNGELENMRRGVRSDMANMQRKFLSEVSKSTGELKAVEGENLANQQEIENTQQYITGKMTDLTTQLANEAAILKASQGYVSARLSEMNGPKMEDLKIVGTTETQAATAAMQKVEDVAKAEEADELRQKEQHLSAGLSDKAGKAEADIAQLGAGGVAALEASTSGLQQQIRDAEAAAEASGLEATKASQDFETSSREVQREAAAMALKAENLQKTSEQNEKRLEEKSESLNEGVLAEENSRLESAGHQIDSEDRKLELGLLSQLDKVSAGSMGALAEQQQKRRNMNQEVTAERTEVDQAVDSAKKGLKNVDDNFKKAEDGLENELDEVQRQEKQAKEEAADESDNLKEYGQGAVERGSAVLSAMGQEADDLMTQTEEGASKIMDNTTAQAEYIEAGNVAAYSGVDTAIADAGAAEGTAEKNMARAEESLFKVGKELDNHRLRFENFTQLKIANFRQRVEEERTQLQNNLEYLDKYDRFTHQKELDLISSGVQLLAKQAKQSDKAFDTMEMEEFKLAQSVGELMGSEEFQTLKKIFETDNYVQEVTVDNENLVNYLRITEEQNIPWMKKVLEALGQVHEDQLAEDDKSAAEQEAAEANTAEKTNNAVKILEEKAAGAAKLPLGELKKMTTDAVKVLNEQGKDEADRSQKKFDELDAENQALDQAMEADYQLDRSRFDAMRSHGENITSVVDSMTSKVQRLLDYNAKVVELERQRLNSLAGNLSDQIFYSSIGGMTPEDKQSSLVQSTDEEGSMAELDSLLKQNQKLSSLVVGLSKKHDELGKEVVAQLRQHNVVVPGVLSS